MLMYFRNGCQYDLLGIVGKGKHKDANKEGCIGSGR